MLCAALTGLVSCNDRFLDTMPDNRAEIDTPEKVKAMLVAAYANRHYAQSAEMYSDNMDDNAKVVNTATPGRYYEQIWNWEDITETANDSPDPLSVYGVIMAVAEPIKTGFFMAYPFRSP